MNEPSGAGGPSARPRGRLAGLWVVFVLTAPWLVCWAGGIHPSPPIQSLLAGLAIFGAACLLSWAAELAQFEIPQALAIVILAVLAVLPEYSVDMVFAIEAGKEDRAGGKTGVRVVEGKQRDGSVRRWEGFVVPRGCAWRLEWPEGTTSPRAFRVDGTPGGSPGKGTIGPDGVYAAPLNVASDLEVRVEALDAGGRVLAAFPLRVTDPMREMALANMTGANRLLIGVGWAAVVFAFILRSRRRVLEIEPARRLEIRSLLLAAGYAMILPFKENLHAYDALALLFVFALYARGAAKQDVEEPELDGAAAALARLPRAKRILVTASLFAFAGFAIFVSAEPFAEGLVQTGEILKIDKFLLVQWLAPLASEAPEFIVAIRFAWGRKPGAGLGCVLSSLVNQWTLLVGMLPLTYMFARGEFVPLHFGALQSEEVLLTVAQCLFAIVMLADLKFSWLDAVTLFFLFGVQLVSSIIPDRLGLTLFEARRIFAYAYLGLAVGRIALFPSTLSMIAAFFRKPG